MKIVGLFPVVAPTTAGLLMVAALGNAVVDETYVLGHPCDVRAEFCPPDQVVLPGVPHRHPTGPTLYTLKPVTVTASVSISTFTTAGLSWKV